MASLVEKSGCQSLPQELESFIHNAIEDMDEKRLRTFRKEAAEIMEESRRRADDGAQCDKFLPTSELPRR
jgi:hypothetical protein